MSDESSAADRTPAVELDADQVGAWLARHPDFFAGREQLLTTLRVHHPQRGNAVSLMERLTLALRDRAERAEAQLDGLLDSARRTEQQYRGLRSLVLALLTADSRDALTQTLATELHEQFGIEHLALWRHSNAGTPLQPPDRQLDDARAASIEALLGDSRSRCLALDDDSAELLLPGSGLAGGSCALTRLTLGQAHGYLALGHASPTHFASGMETLFVDYLGEVVIRLLLRETS
ncbi:DUF484 family protein [Kushneria aurantia]|uniref:DUF484 family protein n=1 Tax=Kushneria aurantia TaxID=504092 RepID=A0ABV6G3T1_9GAMM|nr:DUF484 family protein [Kushneria aurantia]